MCDGERRFTPAGNQRPAPKELLVKWTKQLWANIDANIIKKSFLKTSISCAFDGSQDDEIWREDSEDEL